MKKFLLAVLPFVLIACGPSSKEAKTTSEGDNVSQNQEVGIFEMRTYYCYPGKLEALKTRFREHTLKLFEKHGMTNIGYWEPLENGDNKLVYLLGYPSKTFRDSAWAAFSTDPEWKTVYEASHQNGPIVDSVVNAFYHYSDFSPRLKSENLGPRLFSIRTYYTFPGKLQDLRNRFANHTLKIFEENGIHNLVYLDLDSAEAGADNILTYFVTFPDTLERKKSWDAFRNDSAWKSAYEASIQNGKLVDSIVDELFTATDFSPIK